MTATFTVAVTQTVNLGDQKAVFGTYASAGGATGGDIPTGLNSVKFFIPVTTGDAGSAAVPTINGTHIFGGTITIVTTADTAGIWMAIGC